MENRIYTEGVQKRLAAALLDIGNKLANPPSSTDELLSLLSRAEHILSHVPQICPCHKVIRSVQDAITPAIHALISDKIFKHHFLDIQVAVAACINEIVRIAISDPPFTDSHMKDIFGLFMVALKQLSCGSGQNFKRALVILESMAELRSCLLMLDLEFPMDAMVIEMFQLFLNSIRSHHSADVYNHMKDIMILMVQEGHALDHTTKFNLCWTLLSSVKMDSKNTSPRSWELGKSVMENCALKLQQLVREAVSERNLNLADYAEIVASLCQYVLTGNDTVPNEEVANVLVANEEVTNVQVTTEDVVCVQVASEEGTTEHEEAETVQFVATDASGDGVSKLDESSQAGQEMKIQTKRSRRVIKPNTYMKPEEGYKHAWFGGGIGSSWEDTGSVKRVRMRKGDQSKNKASMNQDSTHEVSNKQKKTTRANLSATDSEIKDENEITAREYESEDVEEKEAESSMSKPTKSKRSKVEKKSSNKGKKAFDGGTAGAENAKVVESSMSKPTKSKQSKAKETGLKKQKNATKNVVVQPNTLDAQKEKVSHSDIYPQGDDENDITSQEHELHEAGNAPDKVVESPLSRKAEYPVDLISEKEKEPMNIHREYGLELVNLRIRVWWPLDQTYYTGTVESYNLVTKKHKIKYDDGDEEMLDMSREKWELFNERHPRQLEQSSGELEADPAPATEPAKTPTKTTKRKAGSSKNEPVGASYKRSKSEGVHSGDSEAESTPVNDDSDNETNFSWKARAMKLWSNVSSKKGKPSPDDA